MAKFSKLCMAAALLAGGVYALSDRVVNPVAPDDEARISVIVQGYEFTAIRDRLRAEGAIITHELGVIDAVAAEMSQSAVDALRADSNVRRIWGNDAVVTSGKPSKGGRGDDSGTGGESTPMQGTFFPSVIGADRLHERGIDGWAIGIATIDTGMWSHADLLNDRYGQFRRRVAYDALTDTVTTFKNARGSDVYDGAGHGSHVVSVAASAGQFNGMYNGVAPGARLIPITALDDEGRGRYADVIRAIDWAVANHNKHGIDVLNLSLNAPVRSHYWDDPLNQAVMAAWRAGIVVVVSAGNTGPGAQSIGVPANVPYVITVGAMTDNYTPADPSDDYIATFSSSGPTHEGFVKPEVVAPGGHMLGLMQKSASLAVQHSIYHDGDKYFMMSGTSQAAAVVSGVAALALQMEPGLSPDQVKCKIMSAARPATNSDGTLAYPVFRQGAGVVNAFDTVYNYTRDCANQGLDIDADLAGTRHFGGRANRDTAGDYYLMGLDGYLWSDEGNMAGNSGFLWTQGHDWRDAYLWSDGYLWTDGETGINGYLWSDEGNVRANGYLWTDGDSWADGPLWANGYLWTGELSEAASINGWVEQQ